MKIKTEVERPAMKVEKCIGFKCDACGKEHRGGHSKDYSYQEELYAPPRGWYTIIQRTTYDGYDPTTNLNKCHACSIDCYIKILGSILSDDPKHDYISEFIDIPTRVVREIVKRLKP